MKPQNTPEKSPNKKPPRDVEREAPKRAEEHARLGQVPPGGREDQQREDTERARVQNDPRRNEDVGRDQARHRRPN